MSWKHGSHGITMGGRPLIVWYGVLWLAAPVRPDAVAGDADGIRLGSGLVLRAVNGRLRVEDAAGPASLRRLLAVTEVVEQLKAWGYRPHELTDGRSVAAS